MCCVRCPGCLPEVIALVDGQLSNVVVWQVVDMTAGNTLASMMDDVGATEFTGYGGLEAQGRIVALLRNGQPVDEAEEGCPLKARVCRFIFSTNISSLFQVT